MPSAVTSFPRHRWTVLLLVFALLFQLGAAAAAGMPSQSCCGHCGTAVAAPDAAPASHCGSGDKHRHDGTLPDTADHGTPPCKTCGNHAFAFAPFVMPDMASAPVTAAPSSIVSITRLALPPPMPYRLERPPRTVA